MAATEPTDEGRANPDSKPVRIAALVWLALVAVLALGLDQLTKKLIIENLSVGEQVSVLGEVLQFHFVKNPGAAFSLASGATWFFSIVACLVVIFILWRARQIRSLGWAILFGMLLGGTLGNLADRLFREPAFAVGQVVDFIQIWGFPAIFNIADSFIVASMCLFVLLSLRGVSLAGDGKTGIAVKDVRAAELVDETDPNNLATLAGR